MNERIKELLLKVVPMEGEDGDLLPSLHTQEDIEKFAELIVKECAHWIETTDSDPDIGKEDAEGLLNYFGVE